MTCPRCNAPADEQTLREFGGVCPKCLLDFSEEQDAPAFPNLEILEMLGQGGMGVVYKATQKNLGRTVALKVLSPHLSADPEFVERFTREARALASLSHPNIVGIYDSGIHDKVPYLVMEYVDGTPLRKMLGSGKLTPDRALEVIPQICDALQYAHAHGVIHRDIKPENILIDRQGRVKIADFGLAKLAKAEETRITQSGYVMGTPRYMAPEQFEASGRVDHRADIYSLGVVFYEMLTGEVPMGRFKPPSEKAAVDRRLDPVVLKSLEREPEDRWQSADEVKAGVARLDEKPSTPRPARGRKAMLLIGVIVGMIVLGFFVISLPGEASSVSSAGTARTGAPIAKTLLILGGIGLATILLILMLKRGEDRKPLPKPSNGHREGLQILGCVAIMALGVGGVVTVLLIVMVRASPEPPAMPVERVLTPRAVTSPAAPKPASGSRWHGVKGSFRVDEVWPKPADLPDDFRDATSLEGNDALQRARLHPGMLPDLESVRVLDFRSGRALIVGLQFRNDFCRKRWEKELKWKDSNDEWHYHLYGNCEAVVFIRSDGSPIGDAARETLETVVERKLGPR